MASRKQPSRIDVALEKLVDHILPNDADDDAEVAQERFERCIDMGRQVLGRQV
jgi:hypothetical protein